MLAQRTDDKHRITVHTDDIQRWAPRQTVRFDLIISNPPYYEPGVECATPQREQARYTATLDHQLNMGWHLRLRTDVAENEARLPHRVLLASKGSMGLIQPVVGQEQWESVLWLNPSPNRAVSHRSSGSAGGQNRQAWLISRNIQSAPSRFISWSIARATISRGASSPRSSTSGINREPSGRLRYAPSPRSASVRRKLRACG